jgi:hypothetical protein
MFYVFIKYAKLWELTEVNRDPGEKGQGDKG